MKPITAHPPAVSGPTAPAARAPSLTKVYGQGETQVVALDHVSVDFAAASSPRSWARPAPASPP